MRWSFARLTSLDRGVLQEICRSRRPSVAYFCAGTEMSLLVSHAFDRACSGSFDVDMEVTKHCFSCEINPAKQKFTNMFQGTGMLQRLFSDVLEVSSDCRCKNLINNQVEDVPLVAKDIMCGFLCQDVARYNNRRLAGASVVRHGTNPVGGVLRAILSYVEKARATGTLRSVMLENVMGLSRLVDEDGF